MSCLTAIRRHLADAGRLILDLFNPSLDALVTRLQNEEFGDEPEFFTADGRRVLRRHKTGAHDRFNQVNQVEHLLARCGFQVEHLYAGFDRCAFGSRYPGELIFVARKAAASSGRAAPDET